LNKTSPFRAQAQRVRFAQGDVPGAINLDSYHRAMGNSSFNIPEYHGNTVNIAEFN